MFLFEKELLGGIFHYPEFEARDSIWKKKGMNIFLKKGFMKILEELHSVEVRAYGIDRAREISHNWAIERRIFDARNKSEFFNAFCMVFLFFLQQIMFFQDKDVHVWARSWTRSRLNDNPRKLFALMPNYLLFRHS